MNNRKFSRRDFIKGLGPGIAFGAGGAVLYQSFLRPKLAEKDQFSLKRETFYQNIENRGLLVAAANDISNIKSDPSQIAKTESFLMVYDLNLHRHHKIPFPFRITGHGLSNHPKNKNILAGSEAGGFYLYTVDLNDHQITAKITAKLGTQFMGHTCFSPNGEYIYCSMRHFDPKEMHQGNAKGFISVRDSQTLTEIEAFDSFGHHPHDLKLINHGKTLIVVNSGINNQKTSNAPSSFSYIDLDTYQLIEKIEAPDGHYMEHFEIGAEETLIIGTLPSKDKGGRVFYREAGNEIFPMDYNSFLPKDITGAIKDIAIDRQSETIAVTIPENNLILLFDFVGKQLKKALNYSRPTGISVTKDNDYFVVNSKIGLEFISIKTLMPAKRPIQTGPRLNCSHLMVV